MALVAKDEETIDLVMFHELLNQILKFRMPSKAVGIVVVLRIEVILCDDKGIEVPVKVSRQVKFEDPVIDFIPETKFVVYSKMQKLFVFNYHDPFDDH